MKKLLAGLAISVFSLAAHAAGSPLNEDFSQLIGISEKILEAAKASDNTTVVQLAEEGISVAKDQGMKGQSPSLQRVSEKLKAAKKAGKKSDFAAVNTSVEAAIAEMKKPKEAPKFGGGSEQTNYKFGSE